MVVGQRCKAGLVTPASEPSPTFASSNCKPRRLSSAFVKHRVSLDDTCGQLGCGSLLQLASNTAADPTAPTAKNNRALHARSEIMGTAQAKIAPNA
jgi:hypothetical protein